MMKLKSIKQELPIIIGLPKFEGLLIGQPELHRVCYRLTIAICNQLLSVVKFVFKGQSSSPV